MSVCLSVSLQCILFFPNNTACFLPGRAKDLSAPPRITKVCVCVVELQNIHVLYIVLWLCKLSFLYRKKKTEDKLPCFCQSHNMDIHNFKFSQAVGFSACDVIGCTTCSAGDGYQYFGRTWCEVQCTSPPTPRLDRNNLGLVNKN